MNNSPHDSAHVGLSTIKLLALALILIVVWGTAYTMVSVAVREVSPIWLVASRTLLGAGLVTAYARWRGHRFPPLKDSRWLWYFGLSMTGMTIPFFLLSVGQITVDSGIASIIAGAMPLATIILAHFFAHEHLTWRKTFGFIVGFAGVVILFLPDNLSLKLVSDWTGQVLILLAALFYAITTVAAKRAPATPSSLGAAMMVTMAALTSTILALLMTGLPETMPSGLSFWMIFGLGAGSTGLATIVYLYVIQHRGPSVLAKINYFPPVVSVIAGIWFLNEPFSWRIIAAFVIILAGVLIARAGTSARVQP